MRPLLTLASRTFARATATTSYPALRPAIPSMLPHISSSFSTSHSTRKAQDPLADSPWNDVALALDVTEQYQPKAVKESYFDTLEKAWAKRKLLGLPVQSDPATFGRSVKVNEHDVAGAYRIMNSVLRRNDVRRELRLQDRYEKPNQMRRRLRSERHRRRFRDLIRKRVQLVSSQCSVKSKWWSTKFACRCKRRQVRESGPLINSS